MTPSPMNARRLRVEAYGLWGRLVEELEDTADDDRWDRVYRLACLASRRFYRRFGRETDDRELELAEIEAAARRLRCV